MPTANRYLSNHSIHDGKRGCESKYDERIISRLKENCYEVEFPEESVRELLAEQKKAEMLGRLG